MPFTYPIHKAVGTLNRRNAFKDFDYLVQLRAKESDPWTLLAAFSYVSIAETFIDARKTAYPDSEFQYRIVQL